MKQINNFVTKTQLLKKALKNQLRLITSVEGSTKLSEKTLVETYQHDTKYYHLVMINDTQFAFCVQNKHSSFHLSEVDIIASLASYDNKRLSDVFRYTYDTVTYDRKVYYYAR